MNNTFQKNIASILNDSNLNEREKLFQIQQFSTVADVTFEKVDNTQRFFDLLSAALPQIIEGTYNGMLLPSGYHLFDSKIGGFKEGELAVIGGRPGMGKTFLMLNLAVQMSKFNPVLFFSYDHSESMIVKRIISTTTKIRSDAFNNIPLSNEELKKLQELASHPPEIYIKEGVQLLDDFIAICERHILNYGVKVIFVDHLQLMCPYRSKSKGNPDIGIIIHRLKHFAREHQVCVIVASGLSRDVEIRDETHRPIFTDLLDFELVGLKADKIIFIYRPEYYALASDDSEGKCRVELIIAKNNSGTSGDLLYERDKIFTTLREIGSLDFLF